MSTLACYFHTVRHLRPIQVVRRVWFQLHRPRPDLRAAPPPRSMIGKYVTPFSPEPTLLAPEVFRFLNVERRCASAVDWLPPDAPKLWTYNLHYFDDLNASHAAERVAWHRNLLERWVGEIPPGHGDGWEPYPVSRRIVNWVKWAARGNALSAACHASLAVQTRWLMNRLEYHILGNHLFVNAKALVHAGLYFDGAEAERWCARGLDIVGRELREQVLPDGGHFELSTMYHAAALEDMLDLVNLLSAHGRRPPVDWLTAIARMQHWLQVMSHPDGDIAFFNDAAFGVAPTPAEIQAYAGRLGLPAAPDATAPIVVLEASGYVRILVGSAYLLCDCAPVGPDHLPAHAHADTLSFELSLGGRRVFVNSGTSQYGTGVERQRQRSTAAHNTVVVDGQDSTEVWAGFRVARRARARLYSATSGLPAVIEASHDGYRRLPGRNEHRRRWTLDDASLCIEDQISGEFRSAEACFHLHPEVEARLSGPRDVELAWSGGVLARLVFHDAAAVEIRPGTWHPHFGVGVANRCISARFSGVSLKTRVCWTE